MRGSLLYLITYIPYIMQAVGLVAIFQARPHEIHVITRKRICKYLQGTRDYGLWYARSKEFRLTTYTDASWEGIIND